MTVRRNATLAVLSVAQFLIALDYSIVYVALPSIAGDLRLSPGLAQWVVSAYDVVFAGFLVVGGRLTDRLGARRLFVAAVLVFGAASAAGGLAGDGAVLLTARGVQGLGAALLQPAVLGLIGTTFPAGPARSRALAVWGSVGAAGLAAGVILGGLLTTASWRLTFMINVPATVACALAAVLRVDPGGGTGPKRVPVLASALGTGAVLALVVGLTVKAGTATLVCLGAAALLSGAFLGNERRSANPLIEPVLRGTRSLRLGAMASALYMASVGSEFFLVTLLLQDARGYPPLRAGLAFLPLALLVTAGSAAAGRAARRYAPGTVLATGFAIATAGLLWLTLGLSAGPYPTHLLPGLLLSGFGHGMIYTSMFVIGTHDVPPVMQGTAGALLTTSQYLSGALTIAVLTIALGSGYRIAFALVTTAAAAGVVLALATRRSRPVTPAGSPTFR